MSTLRNRVNAELDRIREEHGGTIKQTQVVQFARDPNTALHEAFARQGLWDDSTAAERARLQFAGQLIRTYIIRDTGSKLPARRAVVSLMDDRKPRSGLPGYRAIDDVLNDEALRENLLQTVLMEMRAFQRKYKDLKELAEIWTAIDRAVERHTPASELRDSA